MSKTRPESTIALRLAAKVVQFAEARGAARARLIEVLGVEPREVDDYDVRVSHRAIDRLWREAVALTGDPAFGLHLAEQFDRVGDYDLFDLRMANAPTLHAALLDMARLQRLVSDSIEMKIEVRGQSAANSDEASVYFVDHEPEEDHAPYGLECIVAVGVIRARQITGKPTAPRRVCFAHGAPPDPREHERILGCPVVFGAPRTEVVVAAETLRLPTIGANPRVAAMMDMYARRVMSELPALNLPRSEQVQRVIRELLRGTRPTVRDVARRMGVGDRTLQRDLEEDGTSFQALLTEVQFEVAKRLLGERQQSAAEIAWVLGFSNQAAFQRAFRRWAGMTPLEYRRAAASKPG